MKIFIIVGMPAAGKNIARVYAESKGMSYFATGDVVRNELKKLDLGSDPETTAKISDELRGRDGMGVTRRALSAALASDEDIVFMEGMRSWPEIELIRSEATSIVVAFIASRAVRKARIISRGRQDDSADAFYSRDMREISYGASVPIALADEYILNTGSFDNALDALGAIVRKYRDE